jgi:hypothetical protein
LSGSWEDYRTQLIPFNWRFATGDRGNIVPTGDASCGRSPSPAMSDSAGGGWRRYRAVGTAAKRALSGADVVVRRVWARNQVIWTGAWHPSALVARLTGERDVRRDLREGHFVQAVAAARAVNVSPDIRLAATGGKARRAGRLVPNSSDGRYTG